MSVIKLNFSGESVTINKKRVNNLALLRKEVAKLFLFSPQDAAEILLTYKDKDGDKIIIENEQDLKLFMKSNIGILYLDISQDSQIYQNNLKEISKDKELLDKLIEKKNELNKLKETKFTSEKKK